jgi:PAS domain S-box-containing protein
MSTPLHRLVARVTAVGLVAQVVALLLVQDSGAIAPLPTDDWLSWASGWKLMVVCFVLTMLGDAVAVRVRHGEETEELTLFEAACVVDVLVLPSHWALVVPVAATVLISTLRRRGPVKILFNGGNLAAAVAALVLAVHTITSPGAGLTLLTVFALTVGMLALTGVNLVALSRVLAVVSGDDARQVVKDGVRLSVVMAIGTVALGGTAVTLASAAPALLPFALMPAVALTFAFKAAAQESEERERSARLLRLSQVLAGRLEAEEMLEAFLDLTRQAFGVDVAEAVLDQASGTPVAVVDDRDNGPLVRPASLAEQDLLQRSTTLGSRVLREDVPRPWRTALSSPLESEGRQIGVLLLGSADKHRNLGARELTLLTSLASALSVALRGASDLRRLVDERHKLKTVVDQSSDGILVLDGEGVVQLWSPALSRLTGQDEEGALGARLGRLVTTSTPDGEVTDAFRAGYDLLSPESPRATVELVLRRDDGEQRVITCAHAGVFDEDGALVRDVVIVHDVTRERQVERMKADFIATVSHELRTPVTPIKGYADLLRRRGHVMTEEKRAECLEIISDRAAHLSRLVEDLLLASRISESGGRAKVDMGDDDLAALLHRAAGDFGDDNARISIEVPDETVPVRCDPVRVIQVLTNLLGNALKYSAPGTPVNARIRLADGQAHVEVADQGRGIPADQVEKVFEKFHRVEDPLVMTTGGTGLGLYIARQLTGAMGGQLTCRSTLNVGSVFTLSLQQAAAVAPAPAPATATAADAAPAVPAPRQAGHEGVPAA